MGAAQKNDVAGTKFEKEHDSGVEADGETERVLPVDLRGRPVDKSKTGTWKSAFFLYALTLGDFEAVLAVSSTLVSYLTAVLHQPVSDAATITTNFFGTCFMLAVLGGFVADSYLGCYRTITIGVICTCLGLGLLTFTVSYSGLQPDSCEGASCSPAGGHYLAPLYVALYTIAFGSGLVKPNNVALGADQFDDSVEKEKKQGVHFFAWFFFSSNIGLLIAFTLGVYLQEDVSRSWGYGFTLMFYALFASIFFLGTPRMRHTRPTGSFLTRTAQVFVAALRKPNAPLRPLDTDNLYDAPLPGVKRIRRTKQLRFLDRAAVDDRAGNSHQSRWKLCSVTQVEECKRILQMIPIWVTLFPVTLVFSQLLTFTVQQGETFDRKWTSNFELPAPSLNAILVISSCLSVPVYDRIVFPFVRRFSGHPYGITPLRRLGLSLCFAVLTMIAAALVERKRLTSVRAHNFQNLPLGAYDLPLSMWWLVPVFFLGAQVEFFLFVSSYQFFYHESSGGTRSIGSSFTYASAAMGYYFSTVLVQLVNRITRHQKGGSWLKGQLNNGGLEKFYWLMAVILAVDFLFFLVASYWYRYRYDWYHGDSPSAVENAGENGDGKKETMI